MNIILFGAPGVIRGPYTKFLTEAYGIPEIYADLLRTTVKSESDLGKRVKAMLHEGKVLPDETRLAMVQERIEQDDCRSGFQLDGYPQTLAQAEALTAAKIPVDYVLDFVASDDDIVGRMAGRRLHPGSGRTYHVHSNPPKVEGKDDVTGEDLILRDDDREETVRARLSAYHKKAAPLIDYYKNATSTPDTRYVELDHTMSVTRVTEHLKSILG
ncbi:nucleoside monophosphate kinase [Streptomyces griseoviridis]|uniref:nucleoside monophosphate kinase n=1 Tax=Streptomyces griseoviridis TaxID=45398 RepID=UPI00344D0880